ncbi:MAG: rhodanese-like domain-containing protein [Cyclobacteriaceae bacterium]|nr:rhodanese-like domain-containing protein [Cyclobacteriaceae bacterium]
MRGLFILWFVLSGLYLSAQTNEYVCQPCGRACDTEVHLQPGTCAHCNMKLVLKSSVQFVNLTTDEFCDRISENPNAILLDVRTRAEFEGRSLRDSYGHFNKAININIDDLEKRLSELSNYKEREILVYCSHSVRSPRAAMLLTTNGFKNVKNLEGGVSTLHATTPCLKKNFTVHN